MANSNDILELLDELYGMVNEAWGVPLGNDKCIIERERAIEIINTVKANLPTSIAESKRLVQARDEFIGNAKREAENLRKSAEDEASRLVNQQEILKAARNQSELILSDAKSKSAELRNLAFKYVQDIVNKAELTLNDALEAVRKTSDALGQSTLVSNKTESVEEAPDPTKMNPNYTHNLEDEEI